MPDHQPNTVTKALPLGLDSFVARLSVADSTEELCRVLSESPPALQGLAMSAEFDGLGRCRRVLHEDGRLLVVLLGWLPGRGSEPRSCGDCLYAFRVLRGVATEVRYGLNGSRLAVEISRDSFLAGSVVGCEGGEILALLNDRGASEPLVTLHVYRPAPAIVTYASEGSR